MLAPLIIKEELTEDPKMELIFEGKRAFHYSAWERISKMNISKYDMVRYEKNGLYGKVGTYGVVGVNDKPEMLSQEYHRSYDMIMLQYPHLKNHEMLIYVKGDIFECEI